jgi:peptidoglycan/LPS O-acetylase OafA/YrhL
VTSSGRFIPEVDGLRFLAIAAVILHHITASYIETTQRFGAIDVPRQWWEVFPKATTIAVGYAGHFGVHLFFAISGFILALPYVDVYRKGRPRPRLSSYFLRRLVRLEPPFMINILVAFAMIYCTNAGWPEFVPHLIPSLLYLHGPLFGQASWINGVAWSLEVEVQFYLVMPLLAYLLAPSSAALRRGGLLVLMLGLAYAAQHAITRDTLPRLHLSLASQLQFFLAGFLLADLYEARSPKPFRRHVGWDLLAAAAGAAIYFILTKRYGLYWLTSALVVALYAGLFHGAIGHAFLRNPFVVAIGGMCYTIYLYHFLIIDLLAPHTMSLSSPDVPLPIDFLLQCATLIPVILLVSTGLFLAIEKPFMQLSRVIGQRFPRRAGSVSDTAS